MKIIVCVKQVLDTAAKIKIKDGRVDAAGLPRVMNPYDEYAVEEAVRIKEKMPDTDITLITLGPDTFKEALKTGLAMGADRAVHLLDPAFDALDRLGAARVLAHVLRGMEYDLILCGRQAVDDDSAQVGPALGVLLGIPFVAVVTGLKFSADYTSAEVTRQVEGGAEIIEVPLPVLLTCQKGLNQPRLPSLKGIMAAKKKEVKVLDAAGAGVDLAWLEPEALRVRDLGLEPPPVRKKGQVFQGSAEEAAARLARILRDEEKLL
ncbi:MAG: electron transfer flavoprotein subunit beta [Nitrospinae bacterium CG11_big_fil_rev_8_21_14_0_20_56_8]|nr:MAG: electron transfer flavoprotein subunit beta [Nitrospinae bacterium CG11_big_fil_rev_8_21_14_0_20_56_8]